MITHKFLKKLTISNIINGLAMRFYRFASYISCNMIILSIKLNPNKEVFKENLKHCKYYGFGKKRKILDCYNIQEYVKKNSIKIKFFENNRNINLTSPKITNHGIVISEKFICNGILPKTYLAEFYDSTIISNNDLILYNNVCLYDEVEYGKSYNYGIKPFHTVSKIGKKKITLLVPKSFMTIESGIHFCKDHSKNYYHWMIECLPRLSFIDSIPCNIPLLVDGNLPEQFYESLNLLSKRNIVKIPDNKSLLVKKLYYPSQLSVIKDNYNKMDITSDILISHNAVIFLRERVFEALNIKENINLERGAYRKIYISRRNIAFRKILNINQVEKFFLSKGFEIVSPENLSFESQVRLFSQSQIIIGQSGAAITNFIFAPKCANILILTSDAPNRNLQAFNILSDALNLNMQYLSGKCKDINPDYIPHSDFYIDIELLEQYLEKLYC